MSRYFIAAFILFAVSLVEITRTTNSTATSTESVAVKNVKMSRSADIRKDSADAAARLLSNSELFVEFPEFEVAVQRTNGVAHIDLAVKYDRLDSNFTDLFSVYARVLTDLTDRNDPLQFRFIHQGEVVGTVSPSREILPRVCEHQNCYLYHTENITTVEAKTFVEQLVEQGVISTKQSIAAVEKRDDEYVVEVQLTQDPRDPTVFAAQSEDILAILPNLRRSVFHDSAVRLVGCNVIRDRYEIANWRISGQRPDAKRLRSENIFLAYGNTVPASVAQRVAEAMAPMCPVEGLRLIVSIERPANHQYELRIFSTMNDEDTSAELASSAVYWGRQIFDQLVDAESLQFQYVDSDDEVFVSEKITSGLGTQIRHHGNYLYYEPGIDPSFLANFQSGLESAELFSENTESLLRITVSAEYGYLFQFAIPPGQEKVLSPADIKELGELIAPIFAGQPFRMEATTIGFEPYFQLNWTSNH